MTLENNDPTSTSVPTRSAMIAYALLVVAGLFGAHRMYLGRWLSGIAYVAVLLLAMIAVEILLVYALGVALVVDLFLIPGMTNTRNAQLLSEFEEHPERFVVSEADDIAPWAREGGSSFWYVLGTPKRVLQFLFLPALFTSAMVLTGNYEFVVFPVIILLTTGLITSLDKITARHPALLEIPGIESALERVGEMRQYYWENEPRVGASLWGMIRHARTEYAPYWKIAGVVVLAVVIDSVFSFEDDYAPYLGVEDATIVIILHILSVTAAVLLILSPLSALSFHYSLSGKSVRLRILTVAALVVIGLSFYGSVQYEKQNDQPSLLSGERLNLRMEKPKFQAALYDNIGMFLNYYPLGFAEGTPTDQECYPEPIEQNCAPTLWLREIIKGIAPDDESDAFQVVDAVDVKLSDTPTPFRAVLFEIPPAPDSGTCTLAIRYGDVWCSWADSTPVPPEFEQYKLCRQVIEQSSPCKFADPPVDASSP